jgi:nucleoside-diphosphate-sugar epimerase
MKILITGHHGYIGSVLAPMARAAGHDVVGVDTFFYCGCDFGAAEAFEPELSLDIRDVTPRQLEGFDGIVHLAALSNDPLGDIRPELTHDVNLEATISLARAAKEAGVRRFVFASSCSMYGSSGTHELLDERAPIRPLTPYAMTKARAEERLHDLADANFSPISMRNATAYGVSPRLRLDVVLNNLAAWAHTTGRLRLLSDGSAWRPLVHVQDISRAALAVLEAPRDAVHDEAFNVGSAEQNVRIRDLAETLRERTGCDVELSADALTDPRSYRVDFRKIERALPQLRCAWTIERGASELISAYATVGLTRADFLEIGKYTRLSQLKRLQDRGALDHDLRWREQGSREGRPPCGQTHDESVTS